MSKDYKPRPQKSNGSKSGAFVTGLLFGLLLGVVATTALTIYLKGDGSPFENKKINAPVIEPLSSKKPGSSDSDASAEKATDDNNFDFYTILPENESTVTEKEINDDHSIIKKDSYFLQVGAFPDESDADNMKAKLALQGFEAVVQTATIPDKGVWHRVRVGPLNDIGQINKVRDELTKNGFNVNLIKVHTESKP